MPPAVDPAPVRWGRVCALCAGLIVANAGWIALSEMRVRVTEITITPLFIGVLFLLFLTVLANLVVRRVAPAAALRQGELLLVFSGLSVATALAGIGNLGFFAPFLGDAFWFGGAEQWTGFLNDLPATVGPRDPESLRAFFLGRTTFFVLARMAAWAFPLLWWGTFLFLLSTLFLCGARVLRRRWESEEHLPFPVLVLPLELTRPGAPLLAQRLLWAGFAIPCFLHSLNALHSLYPSLPTLPINSFRQGLADAPFPWTGLGSIPIMLHPCGVGTGFLVQTDVLTSLLFFWTLKKLLNLWGTTQGWRDPGPEEYGDGKDQFPFTLWQAWGAWLTVGLAVLWTARGYLRGLRPDERRAAAGAAASFAGACAMAWAVGAPWWVPPALLGGYALLLLAVARMESETPVMSMLLAWVSPQGVMTGVFGTAAFGRRDLVHLATLSWFNLDYRSAVLPQHLHALVGAHRTGVSVRAAAWALAGAAALGIVAAILWDLELYHRFGAATAQVNVYRVNAAKAPFRMLAGWLGTPTPPNPRAVWGMGVGGAATLLLTALRARFVGFPLAPSGYVLTTTFAHEHYWLDMAVALACKATILRYGGMKGYRSALPFFLGLLLGDFVTGAFWSIVAAVLGVEIFRTFPN